MLSSGWHARIFDWLIYKGFRRDWCGWSWGNWGYRSSWSWGWRDWRNWSWCSWGSWCWVAKSKRNILAALCEENRDKLRAEDKNIEHGEENEEYAERRILNG